MRLTFTRVALAALLVAMPPALYAYAQDQAPSSAPSSAAPSSAAPASAEPSSAPPADPSAPSAEPSAPSSAEPPPAAPDAQVSPKPADKHPRTSKEIYEDLDFFGQVFDRIRSEYVDPPYEQSLIRAAIIGMLTSLDPHSSYMDPAEFEQTLQDTSGQFGGLGIEVTMD